MAEIEFALDRFAAEGGRLVVEGRWYGIVGRRFVRPHLQVEGKRRLIAVLDHKPWPAEEGVPWTAAFKHEGKAGPSRLQVAPDIAVELPAPGPGAGDGKPRPARVTPLDVATRRARPVPEEAEAPAPEPEPAERDDEVRNEVERLEAERDVSTAARDRLKTQRDEAVAAGDRLRTERDRAREEAEAARIERDQARAEADALRRSNSESDALRRERDEARAEVEQLRAEVHGVRAAEGRALAERDAARDEVERLSRTPDRPPLVAPRPVILEGSSRRPNWAVRIFALIALGVLVFLLIYLLVAIV